MEIAGYELIATLRKTELWTQFRTRDPKGSQSRLQLVLFPAEIFLGADFDKVFDTEIRRTAVFKGPNLVPIVDYGQDPKGMFVVTAPGDSWCLRDILEAMREKHERPPSHWEDLIVYGIASALVQATHLDRDAVHGEITPETILIDTSGTAKLDFWGTSRVLMAARMIQTQVGDAHFRYFSPEHMLGDLLTPRSDLFSLGLVWYELLTGKPFFQYRQPLEALEMVLGRYNAPQLHQLNCNEHKRILTKLLQKDPHKRYDSASELLKDMQSCAQFHFQDETPRYLVEWIKKTCDSIHVTSQENPIAEDFQSAKEQKEKPDFDKTIFEVTSSFNKDDEFKQTTSTNTTSTESPTLWNSLYSSPKIKIMIGIIFFVLAFAIAALIYVWKQQGSEPKPPKEEKKQEKILQDDKKQRVPRAKLVHVKIDSIPIGAQIYVAGVLRGTTPRILELNPGKHEVIIRTPGYLDWSATLRLRPGKKVNISPQLEKAEP